MRRAVFIAVVVAVLVGIGGAFWAPARAAFWVQDQVLRLWFPPQHIPSFGGTVVRYDGGSGSPVVLLHGFSDRAGSWLPIALDLVQDHRVVLIDLPGHGGSAPTAAPLDFAAVYAGVTVALADIDEPVTLVGNSLGGWLAMLYAVDHPERVSRVVPVNAAGLAADLDDHRSMLIPADRGAMRSRLRVMWPALPAPAPVLDDLLRVQRGPELHSLYDSLAGAPHLDARLDELTMPVDLIWGTPDPLFPLDSYAQLLTSGIPGARMHVLQGCGHPPQIACAQRFADTLRDVLDRPRP